MACLGSVCLVGAVDHHVAHVAFSIFYLIPICVASWYAGRVPGAVVAVSSASVGFVADIWATTTWPTYAYANLCLRLILFVAAASVFARLKGANDREKAVAEKERADAENERAAALRLAELNRLKGDLILSVVEEVRAPLAEIYARVVTLGFESTAMTETEIREALNDIAEASRELASSVNRLVGDDQVPV